ncbi:ATPase/DNA helicase [Suhomyces tanzawaensis NRRL Y-17324]|uniref:DNA repair protein RAD5 n=1 Tax=Suhomyces tanzawaensis NRRL Y-17324 TaxID=984487 RepID=A0A1E4SJH8_9ASCO|nr:ATPase/DNA helicase [Suhomyces tanzawaensis NRRL Y-17324]ODV79661.1 ATPase/DNA helicase [Suhomyces tanzawaensis NRRL Y-17324]
MTNLLQDDFTSPESSKRMLEEDPVTQIDNLYHRMHAESSKIKKEIDTQLWRKFIGSLPIQAWATRPTMKPLEFGEKLTIKRLIPKKSNMSNSSIIRLCTCPKNGSDLGREIARIPEDLTRIFSPLLDLDISSFDATVIESTKKRLSTGDSFFIQVDIFLKNTAFKINSVEADASGDLKVFKKQKTQTIKSNFDFGAESENESVLRLRQFALSKLFEKLSIKPTKHMDDQPIEPEVRDETVTSDANEADPISLDTDSELDEEAPEVKPVDHVSLDQLKQFYQENNQSSLLNSLPETTKPPSSNFKLDLRPYQKHGLSWMLTREKEVSTLEVLASEADNSSSLSTQSKNSIKEREEGMMNPLWRRYKWPRDTSAQSATPESTQSQSQSQSSAKYFYANMYNGELSVEKPLIKSTLKGGILADEMGLGKTISALSLINSVPYDTDPISNAFRLPYASRTTLIVVPMSLLSQWKLEFDKANNNENHYCYIYYGDSTENNLKSRLCNKSSSIPLVMLTTYGTLVNEFTRISKHRNNEGHLPQMGLYSVSYFRIILDEAHNIRNRSTKSAKSIYELSLQRKWALTGTPIINRLDDLYSLVKFLELDPWCNFSYWKTFVTLPFEQKKISQTLDVIKSILEPIFLRRTKNMKQKDGRPMVELPPKEVIIEEINFNQKEEKLYNWFKARANKSFKEGMQSGQLLKQYSQILTHILRLRQICCHMDLVGTQHDMEDDNNDENDNIKEEMKEFVTKKITNEGFANESESNKVMYSLFDKVNLTDSECSICTQSPIHLGEMVITPCGHQFCLTCLIEHIDFQNRQSKESFCPNCRESVSKYKLFKVRSKETSKKEIRFHTNVDVTDPSEKFKFQLYLYDPDRASSKIQALMGHLRSLKLQNPGEKVIVFSQFSSYLDIIENEIKLQGGKDFIVYKFDGRLQLGEREKVLEKFNTNDKTIDKITILLLSLKAGGVGLNLTTASRAFMMDPWWSPSVEDQAIDRIHRIGQNETVKVIRFIVENSIETKMLKIQERKKQIGEAVGAEEEERRKRRIEEIQILFEE